MKINLREKWSGEGSVLLPSPASQKGTLIPSCAASPTLLLVKDVPVPGPSCRLGELRLAYLQQVV
jgi:hypothetical protein